MEKTIYRIEKMDCPTEEQIIRMKLSDLTSISGLEFDLKNRQLAVFHLTDDPEIFERLTSLKFNSSVLSTERIAEFIEKANSQKEKKLLYAILYINAAFFFIEIIAGFFANSMGLIADSLDMLADSVVYALALFAIGGSLLLKKRIAKLSGYSQLLLCVFGFLEVMRRYLNHDYTPLFKVMIIVSFFALIANVISLILLQKNKSEEAHMKAVLICTSSDVLVNAGVILAGILVYFTQSFLPDLIIGFIVFFIVGRASFKILELSK